MGFGGFSSKPVAVGARQATWSAHAAAQSASVTMIRQASPATGATLGAAGGTDRSVGDRVRSGDASLGRQKNRLKVLGAKTRLLGDTREHVRTEFFVVVECKYEVCSLRSTQGPVGTRLPLWLPADSRERGEYATCLCRGPVTHAARNETSRSSAGASACSSRSARTRSANAWTRATASSRVAP